MEAQPRETAVERGRLPGRFWLYLGGQSASNLGSAVTSVAFPLLVFRLTGSAAALGATTAITYLPWVAFGLVGGAVMDRVDRKRVMIGTDVARGLLISAVPVLAAIGVLAVGWIYAVAAVQATLQILFSGGAFTAEVALVAPDDLAVANARFEAARSAAGVAGTSLAGVLFAVGPIVDALWVDGLSFFVSAGSLALVRGGFNLEPPSGLRGGGARAMVAGLVADTRRGLAYVWHRPLLRWLSAQITVVNLFGSAATAEVALFAIRRLGADNAMVGYLEAASGAGVVALSLVVRPLARRLPLRAMVLAALLLYSGGLAAFGTAPSYAVALVAYACVGGATVIYNASTSTLRQRSVPNHLLGRVSNVAIVFAWCAIPVGSLAGGAWVSATGAVRAVYVAAGVGIAATAVAVNRLLRDESGGAHGGGGAGSPGARPAPRRGHRPARPG